jgi:DNA-binding CsgD family transcriptional regulator
MKEFLMVFYVILFSTGFMGGTALFLLHLRVRSRLLNPLLMFQLLFLAGTGLILVYFDRIETSAGNPVIEIGLPAVVMAINIAVWITIIIMCRRISPPTNSRYSKSVIAQILILLVIAKSLANVVVMSVVPADAIPGSWHLASHVLTALAMTAFGVVLRGPVNSREPKALHPLFRAYGLLAILFAPAGLVEHVLQSMDLWWGAYISLDHVLYLSWNIVSMTAAIQLFRPGKETSILLDGVPAERIHALGLSPREVEIAGMIGRGLSNKDIAAALYISPATVRTHIYNLYQKVGAGSRVELLNMLRG